MSVTEKIQIGMGTEHSIVVGRDLTIAHGNDTFPAVFSTPSMIENMELACTRSRHQRIPAGAGHVLGRPEDRVVKFTDPSGYLWGVATHKEDVTPEQIEERLSALPQR